MPDFFLQVRTFIQLKGILVIPPKRNRRWREIGEEDFEVLAVETLSDPSIFKQTEEEQSKLLAA